MASLFNKIKDIVSGVKVDSGNTHNGKPAESNINGHEHQNGAKHENIGDIYSMVRSAPLMSVNTEYLKEYDYWRELGEKHGINGSEYAKTAEYVAHVSRYMAECVEQEKARKEQIENISKQKNDTEKKIENEKSNDTINSSSKSSSETKSDEKIETEAEKDKNNQNGKVDDSVASTTQTENVYDEEEFNRIKEKREKYEKRLDEIRDLKNRMVRSYWNGLTDELNYLLYKIFHSLKVELESLLDGHQNKNEPLGDPDKIAQIDNIEENSSKEYSKGEKANKIVDEYEKVYEKVDAIRRKIKYEEEVDGYAFYKTRLMIFLMILGLFFGIFVELAFMSKYTGKVLDTGTLYDAIDNYQKHLSHAIADARHHTGANNSTKDTFDIVIFILSFPVMDFVEAHFVFFFSLLPFVFGFIIKIWLDQINQKEKSDKEKTQSQSSEFNNENQIDHGRKLSIVLLKILNNIVGRVPKVLKSYTLNDKAMFVFILILILYTTALGTIIGNKFSIALGFYAAFLSLGLMISMGLIMHNLVKTYSRYKAISKRGLFKKNSLEYALDKEYKEVNKLLENIFKEAQIQKASKLRADREKIDSLDNNKGDEKNLKEKNSDESNSGDGKMGNADVDSGIKDDKDEVADGEVTVDEIYGNGENGNEETADKVATESGNKSKEIIDAEKRIDGYVKSCKGAFESGVEYGKSIDVRGEIDKEYLENHEIEEIVETQHKYEKYSKLFDDKIKSNKGGTNGEKMEDS